MRWCVQTVVYCLLTALTIVRGDLTLTQVQVQPNTPGIEWEIEGLASYEYDGCCPRIYHFYCKSTINNGNGLIWAKKGGGLTKSQNTITNGVSLVFSSPIQTDAGVYICSDSASSDSVELNITTDNPAAQPKVNTITAVVGDSVTIEFYASSIPAPQAANITWKLNNINITSGDFDNNKKQLTIASVGLADSGIYKFVIVRKSGNFQAVVTAETTLNVLVPPSILTHPSNISGIEEWGTLELTCIVTGTLPIKINWFKVGGVIPSEATQSTNTINSTVISSTLTLPNVRIGQYYCKASFNDDSHPTQSNTATVSINGGLQFVYTSSSDQSRVLTSPLLYVNNTSFNLSCEGSGSPVWIDSNGTNVSMVTTDIPYQEMLPSLFQNLVFNTYSGGLYYCYSDLQVIKSVFITNSNPAIYTSQSMIRVGLTTNTSLTVYTSGQNPIPSAKNIFWYFQGKCIDHTNPHYHIQNDNSVLIITAPSANVIGQYEARVSTSQGTNSAFIHVSYYDPPIITTDPDVNQTTIIAGENIFFFCNATGDLKVTILWQYEDSVQLPSGVMTNGHTLIIQDASNSQSGIYQCVATDGVSTVKKPIELIIKYSPTAGVGKLPINTSLSLTEIVIEGVNQPTFFCTGTGYPTPMLSWEFNGNQTLPSGIVQYKVSGHLQLEWNRSILYSDEGVYTCKASNELNSSSAHLFLFVNITSVISPTVNPTSRSTLFLNPLLWSVIVTIIVVTLAVIALLIVVLCIRYYKRQNENNKKSFAEISQDPVTDKCVSCELVEMFSHQMTQQPSSKNVPTPSGADHPNKDIDLLPQKSIVQY